MYGWPLVGISSEDYGIDKDLDSAEGGTTPSHVIARSEFEVHWQMYKE